MTQAVRLKTIITRCFSGIGEIVIAIKRTLVLLPKSPHFTGVVVHHRIVIAKAHSIGCARCLASALDKHCQLFQQLFCLFLVLSPRGKDEGDDGMGWETVHQEVKGYAQ